jgi:hypothetical protein
MRQLTRITLAWMAAAALVATAAACKKADTDRTADTATATSTGTVDQPAATTLRVTDVDLGRAMAGVTANADKTDDFKPNDTIHAVVRHEGAASGATLAARWTFQDGQVVDTKSETISPTGTRAEYTHFFISKPSGWPKGKYTLHVLLNGSEVQSKDFEVK